MNDANEFDLLSDIAKLLKKHGPGAFERLAQQLSSPGFVEHLSSILSASARASRRPDARRSQRPNRHCPESDYRSSLVDLKQTQPEKSALLVKFYDDLMAKAVLPTMQELRSFALHSGLPAIRAGSRPKVVTEVLESLRERPLEEVTRIVAHIEDAKRMDDRSLEGWARIILNKELRSKKAE